MTSFMVFLGGDLLEITVRK